MAQEIQVSVSMSVSKNGISVTAANSLVKDMTGTEMAAQTQSLTTTAALVNLGSCDQAQNVVIKNLSSTESVNVGLNTPITQRFATIKPLGAILLEQCPTTIYAATVAGTADIWVAVCED